MKKVLELLLTAICGVVSGAIIGAIIGFALYGVTCALHADNPAITGNEPKTEIMVASAMETEKTIEMVEEPIETRKYFDIPLDQSVQDCIFNECEKAGISPALVVAIIERESNFDPEAVGDDGRSVGLMQIMIKWHLQRMADLNCENLLDPCQNVKVGINYLSELKSENSNIYWVLMSYNGGQAYANKKMASGEISDFATSIIARAYELGGDI